MRNKAIRNGFEAKRAGGRKKTRAQREREKESKKELSLGRLGMAG